MATASSGEESTVCGLASLSLFPLDLRVGRSMPDLGVAGAGAGSSAAFSWERLLASL